MPLIGRAAISIALLPAVLGCAEHPAPKPNPTPVTLAPPVTTVPMECRMDPVSLSSPRKVSGHEMCFTSGAPDPWWMRYRSDAEPPPAPETEDAGAADAAPPPPPPCPPEMILVEGLYCPNVRQHCLRYIDDGAGFLSHHRCAKFDENPQCLSPREQRRFCIDRDEYVAPDTELPLVQQSWTMSKELCESLGKRLCFESEWQFACEGEKLLPYPYGFERNAKLCNHDLTDLEYRGKLRDKRVRPEERPDCVSPFGVRNMVGNVDEWAYRDDMQPPWRAALRGGWWLAGRNNCRAATTGHDEFYFGAQTGVRCCANPH